LVANFAVSSCPQCCGLPFQLTQLELWREGRRMEGAIAESPPPPPICLSISISDSSPFGPFGNHQQKKTILEGSKKGPAGH
jgi:hypothetical protein